MVFEWTDARRGGNNKTQVLKSGLSMNEEAPLRAGSVETVTTQRPHILPLWQAAHPLFSD